MTQQTGLKAVENQTRITEAIHEESISQANTPKINAKATHESLREVVQEAASKDTAKTNDKPASTTNIVVAYEPSVDEIFLLLRCAKMRYVHRQNDTKQPLTKATCTRCRSGDARMSGSISTKP